MSSALVVGSGFGGLAAALRLLARGYQVHLVEAGEVHGGRARVFEQDGFTFDAGPTVITAPHLFDELFELFGNRREDYVEFVPVDPFYRCQFNDGTFFDYVADDERLIAQIAQFEPRDVDGYRRLVRHAQQIFEVGYEQLADKPFGRVSDMLRIVPDLARLSAYRSVFGLVSKYISNPKLRQVFSFEPLLVGGNPLSVPGIYLLIHWLERKWGVHYAKGGTGAIVRALVQLFEEQGGTVELHAPVGEVIVENGKACGVLLEDGRELRADLVVMNADPTQVYSKMVDPRFLSKNRPSSVKRKRQSMSLFVGYFGTDRAYPDIKHHTIVLGPRYQGLLRDVFDKKILAEDFSLYLHRPGASDAAMAPSGKEAFYVLSPVPNQLSGLDWAQKSEEYFERILEELERRVLPGLTSSIVTRRAVDPRYFQNDLRSTHGAAFGLEPSLVQSAYFRYHNACSDIDSLFFVGASTHPGAGMPGVLCSAKVLERLVPLPARAQGVSRTRSGLVEGAA